MKRRKLVSQKKAAELVGVSVRQIGLWLDKGLIPYLQIGKIRKIDPGVLFDWYDNQIFHPNNKDDSPRQGSTERGNTDRRERTGR